MKTQSPTVDTSYRLHWPRLSRWWCGTFGRHVIGIGSCHSCTQEGWDWKRRAETAEASLQTLLASETSAHKGIRLPAPALIGSHHQATIIITLESDHHLDARDIELILRDRVQMILSGDAHTASFRVLDYVLTVDPATS
jgi:hypothetical protein